MQLPLSNQLTMSDHTDETISEDLEQRLLRLTKSGENVDLRKAVRKGSGKPNWRHAAVSNEEQGQDVNPNLEPVKESVGVEDGGIFTPATKTVAKLNSEQGRFPNRRGRPHLGSSRRLGKISSVRQQQRTEEHLKLAATQVVQTELLLQEESGYIELEPGESVHDVTQRNLKDAVDITAATKIFDLELHQYGPYCIDYTRNGRHLLLGGRKGHVAVVEWLTKRLMCEVNVMEAVYEVAWLHQETMFAVAQKDWLYIYDNQGIELHCIERMRNILRMEYLPYHFLLAAANDSGFLHWLDISVGKIVSSTRTHSRRLDVMSQNPWNAVLVLGHTSGTVTMWSPSVPKPLVTMLCHRHPVRAVAVDTTGNYMATAATDGFVKMWDLRAMKSLHGFEMKSPPTSLAFSQRGLLAVGTHNSVQILKDCCTKMVTSPYLCHSVGSQIRDLVYCPYEDVLGIGNMNGFSSILVPGASEANFDSLECNPFQTRKQRRQQEVRSLLDKIQPEMICLDPAAITSVNNIPLDPQSDAIDKATPTVELKSVTRGKSGSADFQRKKNARRDVYQREVVREELKKKTETDNHNDEPPKKLHKYVVLDRFTQKSS